MLYRRDARLPEGVKVLLVHARQDAVVPIEHSRALARTGTPGMVELIETDDDHALRVLVASGQLIELVRRLGS